MDKFKGFSSSLLKIIAIISMTIDHFGVAILKYILLYQNSIGMVSDNLENVYSLTRYIGRLAFPIYCFLLVEGFYHTSNKLKYSFRLLLFCFISEIPFNLALKYNLFESNYQNVFFTLLIGFIAICLIDKIKNNYFSKLNKETSLIIKIVLIIIITFIACLFANILKTDYSDFGVLAIILLYLFHSNKPFNCIIGSAIFGWEKTASFAFIPIYFYNGQKGLNIKYFFYIYYPLHLIILYFLREYLIFLGIINYF